MNFRPTNLKPAWLHCLPCQEAKIFAFSFEREAMILGVGYFSQVAIGHGYTLIVGAIYTCLAARPAVKAAREAKAKLATN